MVQLLLCVHEPASGRQYGDGHSQSYGTSWNNHYQSPTKGSSYDSRYDAPEKGDSDSDLALFDPITQASTIGEVRRNDIQVSPGFKPGVLEHGFLPILPPKHHISRRSLSDEAAKSDYQPYYSNYKGRHGYRNYKTQQDPYQRYLPREDENDPYFRYASRENIQHSHESDVPPELVDERLKGHQEHDLYGTRGTRRPTTFSRNKPRHAPRVESDYDYYYDDNDRERPRYDGEQRRTAGYGPGYDNDYGARREYDRDYRDGPP
ncbi:hypothetical protein FJT64_010633 [Amphibalanus amphitrite]|uniref:Uncharacterized protein n=1 Tax=Amphibalanus amphitrite TaxID=1232801 RepID=A0A6A4VDI9_AMPAM|nr:hypothetical protein FJT64_010633 [Amphibalanus amphitrite]